jgi:hypothetical protein
MSTEKSSTLAAAVSGPNPAWFRFMGSNERDDLEERINPREELLHWIVGAAAYVWRHPETINGQ